MHRRAPEEGMHWQMRMGAVVLGLEMKECLWLLLLRLAIASPARKRRDEYRPERYCLDQGFQYPLGQIRLTADGHFFQVTSIQGRSQDLVSGGGGLVRIQKS